MPQALAKPPHAAAFAAATGEATASASNPPPQKNNHTGKRNKKLGGDKISDYEVIINTIKNLYKLTNIKFDYLVYLQPTSPVRRKKQLLDTLKKVIKYNFGFWHRFNYVFIK